MPQCDTHSIYIHIMEWNWSVRAPVGEENLVPRFHGYGKVLFVTEGVTLYFHENHTKF